MLIKDIKMPKVGDRMRLPVTFSLRKEIGTVISVNPKNLNYVVEFDNRGMKVREGFKPTPYCYDAYKGKHEAIKIHHFHTIIRIPEIGTKYGGLTECADAFHVSAATILSHTKSGKKLFGKYTLVPSSVVPTALR